MRRLVDFLREQFCRTVRQSCKIAQSATFDLLHDDALEFLKREPRDWSDWKLVANLPYSVASPILVELACGNRAPKRIVATLQLEVAQRLMAQADDDDYGDADVAGAAGFRAARMVQNSGGLFFPAPDVDSACVVLDRREQPLLPENLRASFVKIVKRAFSQRRKMMLKLLKADWPKEKLEAAFAELENFAAGTRGEIEPGTIRGVDRKSRRLVLAVSRQGAENAPFFRWRTFCRKPLRCAGFDFMPEEIFDVVNERDEVIDRKPRSEVHARGLLHRAVHVLVFNSRGEIFLQKRSMKKDRQPGVWDSSCSGHVDSGEKYDETAVRELGEELGLKVSAPLQKLFKIDACAETDAEFVWIYRCESDGPFQLHPDEIETGGWFTPEKVSGWIAERPQDFATAFVLIWKRFNR